MEKGYMFRIYPKKEQRQLLAKLFGCKRYIYNYYLAKSEKKIKQNGKRPSYYENAKDLTQLKKQLTWLQEADNTALQNALRDLNTAYERYYNHESGYPVFKSRRTHYFSYRSQCINNNIEFLGTHIKLPKLGYVKTRNKLIPEGRILSAKVSQEPSGKYYVSITCTDVPERTLPKTDKQVGLDLGLHDFAISSDNIKYPNPKYLDKSLAKLAKLQRQLSRKTKDSHNRNKARIKVARLQEHIANQRRDTMQKLSTELIKTYDIICIEDLKPKNMLKNHKLARSISDVSWSEFVKQLQYKAEWYGKDIIKISPWNPSSQTCHICGHKNPKIKDMKIRDWDCPQCHNHHDRDMNAAINILNEGLRLYYKQVA